MQAVTPVPLVLTDEERDVLLELLDRERTALPVEIHHTRTSKFRDMLRRRLEVVTELLNRLED